jgi:hypothetical protein
VRGPRRRYFSGQSLEATRLWVVEQRLSELLRHLLDACEKPTCVRRQLLDLARQVEAVQRRTIEEAQRR